jgi:hypothetical protein
MSDFLPVYSSFFLSHTLFSLTVHIPLSHHYGTMKTLNNLAEFNSQLTAAGSLLVN